MFVCLYVEARANFQISASRLSTSHYVAVVSGQHSQLVRMCIWDLGSGDHTCTLLYDIEQERENIEQEREKVKSMSR